MLYPAPLRDLLLELATTGLFRAKWTHAIQDEWVRSLLKNRPDLTKPQLARTCALMNTAVPDCLVAGYGELIGALHLPDPEDRHVLAAAIAGGADSIITFNLKDFPESSTRQFDIFVEHPDDFIWHQLGLDAASVVISAQRCLRRLKSPALTADAYLDILEAQSLPKTVSELRAYAGVL